MSMYVKVKASPQWIADNAGKIITILGFLWGIFAYGMGWFNGVNAAVKNYPEIEKRLTTVEKAQITYSANFSTFLEMYKLNVLGKKAEAQEIARGIPLNKP